MYTNKKAKNHKLLDGLGGRSKICRTVDLDFPLSRYVLKYRNSSILIGSDGSPDTLFTDDSKLYITPDEYRKLKRGERIARIIGRLDSLHARAFEKSRIYNTGPSPAWFSDILYLKFKRYADRLLKDSSQKISLAKAWNLSIVGSIIFGMLVMTMIYRNLGQSVSANISGQIATDSQVAVEEMTDKSFGFPIVDDVEVDVESISRMIIDYNNFTTEQFAEEIRKTVAGYPIEKMIPEIAKQDRTVAAFLIGIAKQESDWGKHVPLYQGEDCFNYWGFRGQNPVGTGGHSCFANPQEAVRIVAKRLDFLVASENRDTPEKMIIWKCGDCSWDNPADMQRWIKVVSTYFRQLNDTN